MNIRTIKHFQALADTLHFGRASDACHISISALSRNIRQLEEELGVLLFNRDNRSVALTAEGKKFLSYAREASTQWDVICNELSNSSEQLLGQISLYCSVTAAYSILYDLLNRFRSDFPGIEIKLHTGDPEHAIGRVLSGDAHISIAAKPATLPRGVAFKPVTVSPLLFIAPIQQRDGSLPVKAPLSIKDWGAVPMILSEGGISRQRVDAWFRNKGVSPRIYAQVAGNEAIVSMVSLGLGVGVVPKIVLDNSPQRDSVQVLPVSPDLEPYHIGLFALNKNLKNTAVNAFWNLISNNIP